MISRVAEQCFWLHRYVERAENTARLLGVNRSFLLDVRLPARDRWAPVIVVSGEQARFADLFDEADAANDDEVVQEYLTWNEDNPVSIASSVRWARENARVLREVISLEMWQSLNGTYHWLRGGEGHRLYADDRDEFYDHVKNAIAQFDGILHNTILHEEAYHFMLLGLYLERAGQTARIIDVKHHQIGDGTSAGESAVEAAHALSLLRSCSATESYFKRVRAAPSGRTIAPFLVLEQRFPRSVLHGLARARDCVAAIRRFSGRTTPTQSAELLEALVTSVERHDADSLLAAGIHEELTRIVDTVAEVCNAIHIDYFDPALSASQSAALQS